jgi:diguanylate cyclase (GGDEF)-like protein
MREQGETAVMFVDVDHFKLVNDSRGHAVGDELLVAVAQRLTTALRPTDTVARFGGDEFVVVQEDVDEHEADETAARLLTVLSEPLPLSHGAVHITTSIGLALTPPRSATDLLRFADSAMYAAKAAGRARVQRFDRSLADEAEQRYSLASDLRQALADDALEMHYQPVVDLPTGTVVGVEALARWEHPELGSVPPTRFVAVAELFGLTHELDACVLARSLREAQALKDVGLLARDAYVAVNLSARNLADRSLESRVVDAVEAVGTTPGSVLLEITESAIMEDTDKSVSLLSRLRDRGFRVAIDDFGTGYSSLAYLRDLPITVLKVDRSFVAHISDDRDALAIVASIVDLARTVGVGVVAEGVETLPQAALLRRLGCQAAQGWLWSRAVPLGDVPGWASPYAVVEPAPARPRPREPQSPVGPEHGVDTLLALHRDGASLESIASALNREGYRTPSGRRWHSTTVARTITEAAYPSLRPDPR